MLLAGKMTKVADGFDTTESYRRGAGAVELATLERWYTRKGIVGSNPTLSANARRGHAFELSIIH